MPRLLCSHYIFSNQFRTSQWFLQNTTLQEVDLKINLRIDNDKHTKNNRHLDLTTIMVKFKLWIGNNRHMEKTSQGKNARLEKVCWCGAEWNPTTIDLWAINRHRIIIIITEWTSNYGLHQDSAVIKHNPTATNLWVIIPHELLLLLLK